MRKIDPQLIVGTTPTRVDGAWITRLIFQIPDKQPEILRIPVAIKTSPPEPPAIPSRSKPANVVRVSRESSVKLLRRVSPIYPEAAKRAKTQGTVLLDVTIDADGLVVGVDVLQGNEELAGAAADAVKQWIYEPVAIDGRPAAVVTTVEIHFELQ